MGATTTEAVLANYIEILEKTNQQLSYWYLPYEVGIGFLTLAIAVLTIGFSIILWRQNINYREIINKIIDEQRARVKDQMEEDSLALLEEHKAQLQGQVTDATGTMREELEQRLASIDTTLEQYTHARRPSSLTAAQKQSILSLLQSFGADQNMVANVSNVFNGIVPHRSLGISLGGGLTHSQNQAIYSLLQSFGAEPEILENVRRVLERNFIT